MISSSGILSTGLKKCSPMKSAGRVTFSARSVIGRVEVFEPSSASGATCGSISFQTCSLIAGSSNTASMTRSAPAAAAGSVVGVIRASRASPSSCVVRPRSTALSTRFSEYALPRSAASCETSLRTTSMPTFAQTYAIAAPIMPAPSTTAFLAW